MKAKKPPYEISLYRTTNGIFPTMEILTATGALVTLDANRPYWTDASAKRGIISLAKRMGLVK